MKTPSGLFLATALFAADVSVAASATPSALALTVATTRSVILTYKSPAPGTTAARTRTLIVEIPAGVTYQNNYVRHFVSAYILWFNQGVEHSELFWTVSKDPFAKENAALYHGEKLKIVRDLDAIAPEDSIPPSPLNHEALAEARTSGWADTAGGTLAQQHLHELVKKERK